MLLPMVFPGMALGLFLGRVFFAMGLSGSYAGVIMAHTLVTLPFMLRILVVSFESMPQDVIDAASNLGAGTFVKLKEIYLPLVMRVLWLEVFLHLLTVLKSLILLLLLVLRTSIRFRRYCFPTLVKTF